MQSNTLKRRGYKGKISGSETGSRSVTVEKSNRDLKKTFRIHNTANKPPVMIKLILPFSLSFLVLGTVPVPTSYLSS
jgi:hypothetical protein